MQQLKEVLRGILQEVWKDQPKVGLEELPDVVMVEPESLVFHSKFQNSKHILKLSKLSM
jgi:hypothetical protein